MAKVLAIQSFNTTTSMGRLTLNMLLSFAQFERGVTGAWIRDKIAASEKKGLWMGGEHPEIVTTRCGTRFRIRLSQEAPVQPGGSMSSIQAPSPARYAMDLVDR